MEIHIRLTAAALVPVLALGPSCVAPRREVRLQLEREMATHVPENGGHPLEVPATELWGSFRVAAREVVAQVDPLAAAEQTFGITEQNGTYRYYARSGRFVAESLGEGLAEIEGPTESVTRGYLDWCGQTRLGPGDCLRLLGHSKTLTLHGRYVVALVMAMVSSFGPMLESLAELANPGAVAVTLGSAVAMYLLLWLLPEPISKVISTSLTVWLIGYLGLDLFWSLVDGWKALVKAVDQAQDFGGLRHAARDFGQVLGPQIGQVLLLLMCHSLGKGLAAKGPSLPRFAQASTQAESLLRVRLAAAGAVRSVALGDRAITVSLASSAVAVTAISSMDGTRWRPGPHDLDWRGSGRSFKDALDEAFRRTGVPREEFQVTKWGKDANGKSFPVEWRAKGGAQVNIDRGHAMDGPSSPHIGYQTAGKRSGGAVRGHILCDDVPVNR